MATGPGLSRIFQTARLFGDASSLRGGARATGRRVGRRAAGRFLGKSLFGMNIFGLIMWAEFFTWLRNAVELAAGKDFWVGTVLAYAPGYEFGFTNPVGQRRHRPFFFDARDRVLTERTFGSRLRAQPISGSRSGIYAGGRFLADIRSVANGRIVARAGRRAAGAAASRFFWGTLAHPDRNIFELMARRTQMLARENIQAQGLIDSGALWESIQTGPTFDAMAAASEDAASGALMDSGASAIRVTNALGI